MLGSCQDAGHLLRALFSQLIVADHKSFYAGFTHGLQNIDDPIVCQLVAAEIQIGDSTGCMSLQQGAQL